MIVGLVSQSDHTKGKPSSETLNKAKVKVISDHHLFGRETEGYFGRGLYRGLVLEIV
jgi:hypothetical protein